MRTLLYVLGGLCGALVLVAACLECSLARRRRWRAWPFAKYHVVATAADAVAEAEAQADKMRIGRCPDPACRCLHPMCASRNAVDLQLPVCE